MHADHALSMIEQGGLMAGMRGHFPPQTALGVTHALMNTGINVFEFTTNSAEPFEAMQAVKQEYGDEAVVGMGTILDADTARRALDLGADFVVAPSFDPEVVAAAHAAHVLAIPGVITPTECVNAWRTGAKLLKMFPIGNLGVEYFASIRGPLNHMKFICNGGMSDENAAAFLKAGASACGMAGWLTGDGRLPIETIRARALRLRAIVDEVRGGVPDRAALRV